VKFLPSLALALSRSLSRMLTPPPTGTSPSSPSARTRRPARSSFAARRRTSCTRSTGTWRTRWPSRATSSLTRVSHREAARRRWRSALDWRRRRELSRVSRDGRCVPSATPWKLFRARWCRIVAETQSAL
jgi:hypothetical protein